MLKEEAISKMVAPGQPRPKVSWLQGIIQIWITRSCDKSCFGCTQGSNLSGNSGRISLEQFEEAVISLKNYYGVVGMFGGNPAIHPQFEELCEIFKEHIPFERRGLWCNNPLSKGKVMQHTFNPLFSNLNVHLDEAAYREFKRDWPECQPVGRKTDSRHSPVYVAMEDIISDEAERWELISNCDINQTWSAMVGVFRGELRAWFCEIAGAQSILHQNNPNYPDTGIPISPDWWKKPITDFSEQISYHCHKCSVPLRAYGELAQAENGVEQVSETHKNIFQPKRKDRLVQLVTNRSQLSEQHLKSTVTYIENSK